MTMRTYRYFACPNGHKGAGKTSENDQPYSTAPPSVPDRLEARLAVPMLL